MNDANYLDLRGVRLPLETPAQDFVTSDWAGVFRRYPEWNQRARASGMPMEMRGPSTFVMLVCAALASTNARPGRSDIVWLERLYQHYGMAWVVEMLKMCEGDWQND